MEHLERMSPPAEEMDTVRADLLSEKLFPGEEDVSDN
jgi:hypothetical protein